MTHEDIMIAVGMRRAGFPTKRIAHRLGVSPGMVKEALNGVPANRHVMSIISRGQ